MIKLDLANSNHETVPDADNLHRLVKIALDSGEVATVSEGYDLFRTYRVGIAVSNDDASSAASQAAILTMVNIARRSLLGGVYVSGNLRVPLCVEFPGARTLEEAVMAIGGQIVLQLPDDIPLLAVGATETNSNHSVQLKVQFSGWRGGVIPSDQVSLRSEPTTIAPAAILAGAIAISEVFQHLRGNPMAGRRRIGMSLWAPEALDWEKAPAGPEKIVLPSQLWLLGLGHLGQAYLWVLGLLPYADPSKLTLMLQDFDRIALSNDSTSMLTDKSMVGMLKTRAMANWATSRGFSVRLIERQFPGIKIHGDEPRVALGGVDNPQARAAYEDAGFDWIVEAGLGGGTTEYLAMRVHTFPASVTARRKWGDATQVHSLSPMDNAAYRNLAAEGLDECGIVRLATRSVGAPFVGTVAASLVIAELLRGLNGGSSYEVIDMTLRDPDMRNVVVSCNKPSQRNPGFTVARESSPPRKEVRPSPETASNCYNPLDQRCPIVRVLSDASEGLANGTPK